MNVRKTAKDRRKTKIRAKLARMRVTRLCVNRTPRHIYAQIISPEGVVIASASSVEASFKKSHPQTGNMAAAKEVGKLIAERAKDKKITKLAFDRSGFRYHGRIKALAEMAREGGLEF